MTVEFIFFGSSSYWSVHEVVRGPYRGEEDEELLPLRRSRPSELPPFPVRLILRTQTGSRGRGRLARETHRHTCTHRLGGPPMSSWLRKLFWVFAPVLSCPAENKKGRNPEARLHCAAGAGGCRTHQRRRQPHTAVVRRVGLARSCLQPQAS